MNNQTFQYYNGILTAKTHTLTITMLDNLTTISLEFSVDDKNQTSLTRVFGGVTINGSTDYFPNCSKLAMGTYAFDANETLFVTDRINSYRCNSKTVIGGFSTIRNVTIKSIDIEDLRVQPFVDSDKTFNNYGVGMF